MSSFVVRSRIYTLYRNCYKIILRFSNFKHIILYFSKANAASDVSRPQQARTVTIQS